MKTKKYTGLLAVVLVMLQIFTASASALTSGGACAINAADGTILYEYNAHTALVPASMTKVMTLYITFDKMNQGLFNKNTKITCSKNAAVFSRHPEASNTPLNEGTAYSVEELIQAAVVPSSCSAALLLSEYIAGSEANFVKMMNDYVYRLGLEAYYEDCSGLSNNNRITPHSMTKLVARFINDYPDILNYTSLQSINFRGSKYTNTNSLLPGRSYAYYGADGFKTGTSSQAGRCITASVVQDGVRVIAVTMRSGAGSSRYNDIHEILNSAFGKVRASFTQGAQIMPDTTKLYIDGAEIPSLYTSDNIGAVVLAEQLSNYGFSVSYNAEARVVIIRHNPGQQIVPVNCSEFENFTATANPNSTLRVIFENNGNITEIKRVYDLSGYAAIPTSELESLFPYTWNQSEMSGYFTTNAVIEHPVPEISTPEPIQEQPVQEQPVQEQPVQEQPIQEQPVQEQPIQEQFSPIVFSPVVPSATEQ